MSGHVRMAEVVLLRARRIWTGRVRQVVKQTAIAQRHGVRDTLCIEVSAVSDQGHRKVRAVGCRDQRANWRVALCGATAPGTARALVMTVGGRVHAIDDEQALVMRLEEGVESGSIIAERSVLDVARRSDIALEKAPHRVALAFSCAALRVAEVRWIPTAACVHEDPIRARVCRAADRLSACAQRVQCRRQNTRQPSPACHSYKVATIHS